MKSHIDVPGDPVSHGYTRDDDCWLWYWEVRRTGGKPDFELSFTDRGTPVDHPIRHGPVPDDVREHATTYVESLFEQSILDWY